MARPRTFRPTVPYPFEQEHAVSQRPGSHRRDFLKTSAAALAAPTIVPASVFAKDGEPAPSDRVVVGSIGAGDLGRRHHLNNKLMPNKRIQMAAVCDVDRNHRDQAALDVLNQDRQERGDIYKDFRDLCDRQDIDAVLIAVPDHWHALAAIYAMESGKDVYCEKPLTLTIDEGNKMVEVGPPLRHRLSDRQPAAQSDKRFRLACELVRNRQDRQAQARRHAHRRYRRAAVGSRRPRRRRSWIGTSGSARHPMPTTVPTAAITSSAGSAITRAAR